MIEGTGSVSVAAIDLGASSGRVMLGEVGPDHLRLTASARFANGPVQGDDGLHWDVSGLHRHALDGLRSAAAAASGELASVGIDSWAVDYGLLRGGRLLAGLRPALGGGLPARRAAFGRRRGAGPARRATGGPGPVPHPGRAGRGERRALHGGPGAADLGARSLTGECAGT